MKALAAGGQDLQPGGGAEQLAQQANPGQQAFEVVHHQQQAFGAQAVEHLLERIGAGLEADPQGLAEGGQDGLRIGERRQGYVANPIGVLLAALRGAFQRQAGFAHPTQPQDGQQAHLGIVQQARQLGQFGGATDERCHLGWQVAEAGDRGWWRK